MRTPTSLQHARRNGFTLIELIVVVVVLSILMAIALPNFFGASDATNDSAAKSYLTYAYRAAADDAIHSESGGYAVGDQLVSRLHLSEPELTLAIATATEACSAVSDDKTVMVSSDSTATDLNLFVHSDSGTTWQLTATQTATWETTEVDCSAIVQP